MKKNWQKILFIFLLIGGFGLGLMVQAGIVPCGTADNPNPCDLCHLWQLGANIINFLLWYVAVPGSALMFVIAGVVFLTSYGSEKRVDLAKTIFTNVVIGLLIAFSAWLIVNSLLGTLASGTTFYGAWNQFPTCTIPSP